LHFPAPEQRPWLQVFPLVVQTESFLHQRSIRKKGFQKQPTGFSPHRPSSVSSSSHFAPLSDIPATAIRDSTLSKRSTKAPKVVARMQMSSIHEVAGIEDLKNLGFNLDGAIDLRGRTRRYHYVWARDAKVPRVSYLVVIDVPTGTSLPQSGPARERRRPHAASARAEYTFLGSGYSIQTHLL
jgi:hypothetical protein